MFKTDKEIKITLKSPEGAKEVVVKFPTDDQWKARTAKIRITSKNLGRGKSKDDVSKADEYNAQLFDSIVQNDAQLDLYEKSTIVERLSRSEVIESYIENNDFVIVMNVPGGEVKHTLSRPYEKQKRKYRESALNVTTSRNGSTEMTVNLQASEDLYDDLHKSHEGYDTNTPVPVIHKSSVISELLNLLKEEEDESDIENF